MDRQPGSNKSSFFPKILIAVAIASLFALGAASYFIFFSSPSSSNAQTKKADSAPQQTIQPAKESVDINQTFNFPLFDEADPGAPPLSFEVTTAEKRDEIIAEGKRATTIDGRTFLIINLKIENPHTKGIEVNTRNFFRLSTNGGEEWLAPDIHNDPVKVQAISTKPTRIGFPINDDDTDLILQVGEIEAEKQQIPIVFSN